MTNLRVLYLIATIAVGAVMNCSDARDTHPAQRGRGIASAGATAKTSANAGAAANNGLIIPKGSRTVATGPNGGEVCASALLTSMKNMPSIVFVIDGSGSMCAPFGDATRWQAMRSALLDPTRGFIYRLQSSVRFGASLYDGTIDMDLAATDPLSVIQNPPCALLSSALSPGASMCPELVEVTPAKLDNAQAIDMAFPESELGGSTPTDKALNHVMDALIPTLQQQTAHRTTHALSILVFRWNDPSSAAGAANGAICTGVASGRHDPLVLPGSAPVPAWDAGVEPCEAPAAREHWHRKGGSAEGICGGNRKAPDHEC